MENPRPRWLEIAAIADEDQASNPNIEAELAIWEGLLALTEYPQWNLFEGEMQKLADEAIERMLDPGVQQMTVIAAYRARVRVLQWLLDLPNRARIERDTLLEEQAPQEDEDGG